ncbi:MAG: FtsX-like permease family protein [Acidobacteriota bacterium]
MQAILIKSAGKAKAQEKELMQFGAMRLITEPSAVARDPGGTLAVKVGNASNTQVLEASRATALGSVSDCVSAQIIKLHQYRKFKQHSNRALPKGAGAFGTGKNLFEPDTPYEIVGLVRDTKYEDLREEFQPIAYYAAAQDSDSGPGAPIFIRSRLQAETVAAVKSVLNEINPAITVSFQGFKPMIEATILRERLMATLSGFFGLLALLLACIGLYGILSYGVASRTNEIGIRMALGAGRRDVFWLILREAFLLVIAGVAVGLPMIFAVTRLVSTLLFGLTPTDPVSLILAALLMIGVAMVAGYLPSRRATRVDPLVALRYE